MMRAWKRVKERISIPTPKSIMKPFQKDRTVSKTLLPNGANMGNVGLEDAMTAQEEAEEDLFLSCLR